MAMPGPFPAKTTNDARPSIASCASEYRVHRSTPPSDFSGFYLDRHCPPAETVKRMQPYLLTLGITRIAKQTGLDLIGIPAYAAFRPNARTLAVNQGKGLDDNAAKASAIMEAAEFAIAESPEIPIRYTSKNTLLHEGRAIFDAARLMPIGHTLPDNEEIAWVNGVNLFANHTVMVPYDAVLIDATTPSKSQITSSTNGLASGNTKDEVLFHALCELIERDGTTLFSLRGEDNVDSAGIDPGAFNDPAIDHLCALISDAGLLLKLFDQTTNLGVPVIMAVIAECEQKAMRYFDLAAGYGCHPVSTRAAVRAITEAAQTRITNIAGARDDFDPAEYHKELTSAHAQFTQSQSHYSAVPPVGCTQHMSLSGLLDYVRQHLLEHQIKDVTVVWLGSDAFGISVVKVLAPQLEDRAPNPNWRPGYRAVSAITGLL